MEKQFTLTSLEDYRPLIGDEAYERIREKARALKGLRVLNFNSTYYGGGVAEMLTSLTLLMNSVGILAEWRVLQGTPDYFSITKKMHNALQGGEINFPDGKAEVFEQVVYENAVRNQIEHDFVVIHDPQPLPLIQHYHKKCPWIWRCHIDLTNPHKPLWKYLRQWVDQYDAAIVSCPEYRQEMKPPQCIFMPAINPFNRKNCAMAEEEIDERFRKHGIPTDLPLIAQVSRFDPWKDPEGVIAAYQQAREKFPDMRLVMLGNFATDDPEGSEIFESIRDCRDERLLVLAEGDDTSLVNALQQKSEVILQKSLREGFGLTVAEAMWKGTPVIGGKVGGIPYQIQHDENGVLVSSVDEAADEIVRLMADARLRKRLGEKARETVREKFLLTRYLEQYLDLFGGFETNFRLRDS